MFIQIKKNFNTQKCVSASAPSIQCKKKKANVIFSDLLRYICNVLVRSHANLLYSRNVKQQISHRK